MNKREVRSKGRNFIRVSLHSGNANNPLGNEDLAIFCQCDNDSPSVEDVDKRGLLRWVNCNPAITRNQSGETYRISSQDDSMVVVYLGQREIQCCQSSDRIFPRLAQSI